MKSFTFVINNTSWQRAAALFVRMNVFVLERNIAIEDEFDENDTDGTTYAVAYKDNLPVATARFTQVNETAAKITRVATMKEYRGFHLGSKLIQLMEEHADSMGVTTLDIHSELTAVEFYKKCGYVLSSEIYLEDGVECQTLTKQLK
ncbi:GNAT family N-acetyltransferase [Enterococcus sp. BWM-S5]|uniref:GNAT family N-acetyltransferase n=1 Tax=Enterococcus larvae TaxID=2794352 RepID=A0ABS4CLA3_9ENTE|nr:GNAT family N-acetyltransferase [Enterococcus larvae]MBP1047387.1 GNAT family N-acetyltransferase [Enterococcus larvae]